MSKKKRNFFVSAIFIILAVTFTVLVKLIDVKATGVNDTNIGFATLNHLIFDTTGVNMIWYHITDWLGLIAIFVSSFYAFIGIYQLIKRKSLLKVDKEIILLGAFYVVVVLIYALFEKVIINYRPTLIDNVLEASYPSSHTLMIICLCGSAILINNQLFNNKITKILNIVLLAIIIITVVGRLLSGVHWFTDIIGGILISIALLKTFHSFLYLLNPKK
jgi:undecaprenyl-diphosphatase